MGVGKMKRERKMMLSFTKVHAAYETVKSFFYMHIKSKCDEQNFFCFLVFLIHFNALPHLSFFFCGPQRNGD
jgi:hypothetical protein